MIHKIMIVLLLLIVCSPPAWAKPDEAEERKLPSAIWLEMPYLEKMTILDSYFTGRISGCNGLHFYYQQEAKRLNYDLGESKAILDAARLLCLHDDNITLQGQENMIALIDRTYENDLFKQLPVSQAFGLTALVYMSERMSEAEYWAYLTELYDPVEEEERFIDVLNQNAADLMNEP